jgi:flagellar biosynthetic protein FliP
MRERGALFPQKLGSAPEARARMSAIRRLSGLFLLPAAQLAAQTGPWSGLRLTGKPGATEWSIPLQILGWMTLLVLLPAAIASVTPFLRLLVVMHFLRQALGTQSTPSNHVLIGLSLFLTMVLMQPTTNRIYDQSIAPLDRGEIGAQEALQRATVPLKSFLAKYVREKDVALFVEISHAPRPHNLSELDLQVLMPAYVLSELRIGFQIGAVLFLPFLIIDLLVASITLSLGMLQLPPVMISAPFKILLFVLVDGWNLVVGSLVKSF